MLSRTDDPLDSMAVRVMGPSYGIKASSGPRCAGNLTEVFRGMLTVGLIATYSFVPSSVSEGGTGRGGGRERGGGRRGGRGVEGGGEGGG